VVVVVEEEEESGLIKDLKRHARFAVAWDPTGVQSPGGFSRSSDRQRVRRRPGNPPIMLIVDLSTFFSRGEFVFGKTPRGHPSLIFTPPRHKRPNDVKSHILHYWTRHTRKNNAPAPPPKGLELEAVHAPFISSSPADN